MKETEKQIDGYKSSLTMCTPLMRFLSKYPTVNRLFSEGYFQDQLALKNCAYYYTLILSFEIYRRNVDREVEVRKNGRASARQRNSKRTCI